MIVRLNHLGFRVDDLEQAINIYKKLGFTVQTRFGKGDWALAAMMRKGDDGIELFQFKNPEDELSKKISNHTAFTTDDIEADLQLFLDNGYTLSIPISPGTVVKRYAYVADKYGVQIELCEPLES
jgi:catechol 2,3-dioxygenase-like lactoylglutathione lyase family enzyme